MTAQKVGEGDPGLLIGLSSGVEREDERMAF